MDWYLISVLIFVAVLAVLVYKDRRNYKRESILLLRRTKRGREMIIKIGTRFPRGWRLLGYVSVGTGLIVSVLGLKLLVDNLITAISTKAGAPSLALLLPSPTAQPIFGYGFLAVPFWYWIICIGMLVLVHEGMHGIYAAREKVKIKSMGVGLLAVIPLAFVEPDEKRLAKKGMWPQLRVFAAGSFGNFLLAGVTMIIIILLSITIFTAGGVAFGMMGQLPYPAAQIELSGIERLGNYSILDPANIPATLNQFSENDTVEIFTRNGTFYLKQSLFAEQLNTSQSIIVFGDYPAARAGIEGAIVKIDGYEIKDSLDLSLALERAGPNRTIEVTTADGAGGEKTYVLTTMDKPDPPAYVPDAWIYVTAPVEHLIPGTIDFSQQIGESWSAFVGQRVGVTWDYANQKIQMWQWVSENYPLMSSRAESEVAYWQGQLADHPRPGFIGITGVITNFELRPDLEPVRGGIDFIQGLLFFLFLINLGVGIINLLPLKPLDGGRMWDAILQEYVPKQAGVIIRAVGALTLLLLLANFIPFGAFM